ncbi:MAG: ABC transporter permease [Planctomycetota bacterium]|nr:ABC transporter permease [Planctomycetota bacterium]
MLGLIVRRLLQLPLILLAVYTLTLALAWAVPGNPLERPEGRRPPAEVAAAMRAQYKLDNFWAFYVSYLDSATGLRYFREHVLATDQKRSDAEGGPSIAPPAANRATPNRPIFDLGPSLHYRDQRVHEIIASSLPASMLVGGLAILLALLIGVPAGVASAARPNSWVDAATRLLALAGISIPSFVIAMALLLIFAVELGWLPVASWGGLAGLILPSFTLCLPFAAYITRLTRLGMLEQLGADYIRTARAKGVSNMGVLTRHALKNAILPVVSYLGPATAFAVTGSFVVERVFSIPGMGQHFVAAVQNKDLFLIIGVVLVYSSLLILLNLAVDVAYRWIDPRIE